MVGSYRLQEYKKQYERCTYKERIEGKPCVMMVNREWDAIRIAALVLEKDEYFLSRINGEDQFRILYNNLFEYPELRLITAHKNDLVETKEIIKRLREKAAAGDSDAGDFLSIIEFEHPKYMSMRLWFVKLDHESYNTLKEEAAKDLDSKRLPPVKPLQGGRRTRRCRTRSRRKRITRRRGSLKRKNRRRTLKRRRRK